MPGPSALGNAAIGIGSGLIEAFTGYEMGRNNANRQYRQTKKLMDYQNLKAMEMWHNTGYGPQVEQMRKAGINPALMYGMGGGGAQTTGSTGGSAAQAPTPNVDLNMGTMMGLQMQRELLEAQKKVLEADARLKNTDADMKAGVGTEEAKSRIDLNKIKLAWDKIDLEVKEKSKEDAIRMITYQADEMAYKANVMEAESAVQNDDTIYARRKEIAARAATAVIQKDLAEMMKTKTAEEINKIQQDIKNSLEELRLKGKAIDNDTARTVFETNLGNRLSLEAVKALGGLANMYIGKKTEDVNKR